MRTKVIAILFLLPLTAGCSRNVEATSEPTPAAASAVDPAGTWDFTASLGGETRTGMLRLERTAEGWGGEATLQGEPDAALVDGATITGNHVAIDAWVNNANQIRFELDFTGNTFSGHIVAGDESIAVTGTRRTS